MHACNLGIYLVIIGEGILLLAKNMHPQLSLQDSLRSTYLKFKQWLSNNSISCSQRRWTPKSLHLTGEVENYPWLKAKAFNARVILGWLAETLKQFEPFSVSCYETPMLSTELVNDLTCVKQHQNIFS